VLKALEVLENVRSSVLILSSHDPQPQSFRERVYLRDWFEGLYEFGNHNSIHADSSDSGQVAHPRLNDGGWPDLTRMRVPRPSLLGRESENRPREPPAAPLDPRQPDLARIHATSLLSANESEHLIVTIARSWPKL
jgi:hypothetical protein